MGDARNKSEEATVESEGGDRLEIRPDRTELTAIQV